MSDHRVEIRSTLISPGADWLVLHGPSAYSEDHGYLMVHEKAEGTVLSAAIYLSPEDLRDLARTATLLAETLEADK